MVVFTCNHCGDSLQKPKVEKHYNFACRRMKSLTCVDCLKDFQGEDYTNHTKCITEDERYAAKNSLPAQGFVKKGELKQESWIEMIKSILDKQTNLKPSHRNLLNTISNYTNVPRKKNKFINFIKSSSGGRINMNDVEGVWDIIEKHKNEQASVKKDNKNEDNERKRKATDEIDTDKTNGKPKTKVRKEIENDIIKAIDEETAIGDQVSTIKFNFQNKILEILREKQTISTKKLQKKVLNAYLKHTGESECTPKMIKKYNKKLKKISNVEVVEDTVKLKEGIELSEI